MRRLTTKIISCCLDSWTWSLQRATTPFPFLCRRRNNETLDQPEIHESRFARHPAALSLECEHIQSVVSTNQQWRKAPRIRPPSSPYERRLYSPLWLPLSLHTLPLSRPWTRGDSSMFVFRVYLLTVVPTCTRWLQ